MRAYLPELIALPLLPFLLAQGRHVRRVTPRLPEAVGPTAGRAGHAADGKPLSLLALGESPVVGVGVGTQEEAITAQFAQALAVRMQRPVTWRAYGKNGATARAALEQVVLNIPGRQVDIALVAFGVNDTTAFRSVSRWTADLRGILTALDARCAPRLIVLSGVPPLAHFPALPQPLRWVMGLKARALDTAARDVALQAARTIHVPLAFDTRDAALMAPDGYHPSARGCAVWAQCLVAAAAAALTAAHQ